jgi:hypothetical protein
VSFSIKFEENLNPQNCGIDNLVVFQDFHWGYLGILKKCHSNVIPQVVSKNTIRKRMVILPEFKLCDVFCEFDLACGVSMHHVGPKLQ